MQRRAIAACLGLVAVAACSSDSALMRQRRQEALIGSIRQALLESEVAEKSAVLATTDEESRALSLEAKRLASRVNELRGELRPLIEVDGRRAEIEKLDAFDAAWANLEDVDRRLLALAVANTNLKAAQLSSREGADALDRLVEALAEMEATAEDPATIRVLSQTAVAALRAQQLLLVHIPTADAAEMARLEVRMSALSAEVKHNLATAARGGQVSPARAAAASAAWKEYRRVSAAVIRLSRANSNVISSDVSVHEKRQATQACIAALAALLDAVRSGPQAAR